MDCRGLANGWRCRRARISVTAPQSWLEWTRRSPRFSAISNGPKMTTARRTILRSIATGWSVIGWNSRTTRTAAPTTPLCKLTPTRRPRGVDGLGEAFGEGSGTAGEHGPSPVLRSRPFMCSRGSVTRPGRVAERPRRTLGLVARPAAASRTTPVRRPVRSRRRRHPVRRRSEPRRR